MARVYDYWLGGKDNYAVDRAAAEQVAVAYPDIRDAVRAQRAFLARAVRFLVTARTHAEACQFFAGLELLEPGVVQVHRWRPEIWDLGSNRNLAVYAGVGRKP